MQASKTKISLGMMSGTSIDGSVSAAIIKTDGEDLLHRTYTGEYCYESPDSNRAVHHLSKAAELAYRAAKGDHTQAASLYPESLHQYIQNTFKLETPKETEQKLDDLSFAFFDRKNRVPTLDDIIERSTRVHAEAARFALAESKMSAKEIDYVGYHGQTLYHDPFVNHVTVQVGDAQKLANELRVPVVFDFRTNDVRHGGQGAPLAPTYHRALVRSAGLRAAAILNLGGTANVTVISASKDDMIGFDTGPANGLLDRYVKEKLGLALDLDSNLALKGKVSDSALQALLKRSIILADGRNYLDIAPPKSLDIRDYTFDLPEFQSLSVEDGCATLNAFTAECVALGTEWIKKASVETPNTWVICGGGANNPYMRQQLLERLSKRITGTIEFKSANDVGWSAAGMEAELFAYLAVRSVRGLPITFPGTTGVETPLPGGTTYQPK